MTQIETVVSAPGKVLLTGAYLILDPQYRGLVLPLSARIKVTVKPRSDGTSTIVRTRYGDREYEQGTLSNISPSKEPNPFVDTCMKYLYQKALDVTIEGDELFYRKGKTGLGSSAAVTTALCAALMIHSGCEDYDEIHRMSQFVHFKAQGVGSGFDVASAVYGSILYRRGAWTKETELEDFNCDCETQQIQLDGVSVIMITQSGGTSTPHMVKKVLEWKSQNPSKAQELWSQLNAANDRISELLISNKNSVEEVRAEYAKVRRAFQVIGDLAGVGIEPQEIRDTLDNLNKHDGVLMAGVPGAGGSDALFCLVLTQYKNQLLDHIKSLGLSVLLVNDYDKNTNYGLLIKK
ncbi:hypothetical protein MP638_005378 [Amoeboaphelidium occidentale]|nr:hypothetical protein MP638_005378 [Amoeboaphelidium occidentale]